MGAILACVGPQHPQARHAALQRMLAQADGRGMRRDWSGPHLQLCVLEQAGDALLAVDDRVVIAVHGRVYEAHDGALQWLDAASALRLWARWGDGVADRLGGNFSLLVHDRQTGRTCLRVCAAGVNTLVLSPRGSAWCIATTPWQALAGADRPRSVDADALARHVLGRAKPQDTCFAHVRRLGALRQLQIDALGRVVESSCAGTRLPDPALTLQDACAGLDHELRRVLALDGTAAASRLALSAGLDSGNLLLRLPAQSATAALTLAFAGPHDESAAAARLCDLRGVPHRVLPVDRVVAGAALSALLRVAQAPVHCAAVCNVLLAHSIQADDCQRVLLGSGGDELFLFHPGEWRQVRRQPVAALAAWRASMRMRPRLGLSNRRGVQDLLRHALRPMPAATVPHAGFAQHLRDHAGDVLERVYAASGVNVELPFYAPGVLAIARRLPDLLRIHGGHPKAVLRQCMASELPERPGCALTEGPQFLPDWLHNLQIDEFFDNSRDQRPTLAARRAFLAIAEGVGWCQPRSMALQDAAVRRWGVTGAARRLSSAAAFARAQLESGTTTTSVQ